MALIQIDRQGIKLAIDEINALRQVRSCATTGSALVPSPCLLSWKDNHYVMEFSTTDLAALNAAYYQGMSSFELNLSGNVYEVPDRGANISNWNRSFVNPDVVSVTISQFRSKGRTNLHTAP
jgi:hypothetical protein